MTFIYYEAEKIALVGIWVQFIKMPTFLNNQ